MDFKRLPHTIHWIGNLWPSSLIHSCQCWISSLSLNFQWWYLTLKYHHCHHNLGRTWWRGFEPIPFPMSDVTAAVTRMPCWTRYLFQRSRAKAKIQYMKQWIYHQDTKMNRVSISMAQCRNRAKIQCALWWTETQKILLPSSPNDGHNDPDRRCSSLVRT